MTESPLIARARDNLDAARHLISGGFAAQAVSRAYFGAFYAAEAALEALGESRSKHSGVIAAFGSRIAGEGDVEAELAAILRSLFRRRNEADYVAESVDPGSAEEALADAERFVDGVGAWLARHER